MEKCKEKLVSDDDGVLCTNKVACTVEMNKLSGDVKEGYGMKRERVMKGSSCCHPLCMVAWRM